MTLREKLRISKALADLNVDIIEAGFPAASPGDFDAVKAIADENRGPIICGLARCNPDDIDKVYAAVKGSDNHRIHVFVATSAIHREYKLKMAKEEIIKNAVSAIKMARELCDDVEFSPEDAGRTDIGYLSEVVEAIIDAGAKTINIPDTTGYTMPLEFGKKIAELKSRVKNIDEAVISVHCHNDLGLAVANSLSAISNGARQVECTINGIGERAGNASLEEIAMAISVRKDLWDVETNINTSEIFNSSKMVSSFTGMIVQPNKAIVGENAFAHESGIHQDGMLKDNKTYEIMDPEIVGVNKSKIVLGRHSGRHGLISRLKSIGFEPNEEELNKVYQDFLKLADKKKRSF
jgi:2-isopropylmalate synthase